MRAVRCFVLALVIIAASITPAYGAAGDDPVKPEQEHSLRSRIVDYLQEKNIPQEAVVFIIAALPVVELRGAVPAAHIMGMHPALAYVISVAGNMVPVFPILFLLGPVSRYLSRFRIGKAFFDWLFARTRRKSQTIEKYETLGLAIFVSIPLPVTGAWTGSVAAFLFGIKFRHAVWAILLGVMASGVIMTVLCMMGIVGAIIAGVVLLSLIAGAILKMIKGEKMEN